VLERAVFCREWVVIVIKVGSQNFEFVVAGWIVTFQLDGLSLSLGFHEGSGDSYTGWWFLLENFLKVRDGVLDQNLEGFLARSITDVDE